MDYKELIRRLVDCDQLDAAIEDDDLSLALEDAVDTIETLLAERDAAVEMLRGECHACKHNVGWHNVGKCCTCIHETVSPLISKEQCDDNWEWRGPKKEGGGDE